jgi:glycosyltransferase involved in cell wall biosynthesis
VNKPLLHVVIPAYGESPYLKETLVSATRNLPLSVPITVLEDPSESNNVREIVSGFLDRVTYQTNTNRLGIGGNFNEAIEISTGTFTLLCGSDDLILGDISQYLNGIDQESAAITSNCMVIDKNSKKTISLTDLAKTIIKPKKTGSYIYNNKKMFNRLMIGDWLYFPAIVWNTKILKNERFKEELHTAMDLDILIRLISKNYKISHLAVNKFAYRRHARSASSVYAQEFGRFDEEFTCHKNAAEIAKKKKWVIGFIFAKLAITVRIHKYLVRYKKLEKLILDKTHISPS